ncbi:MAG: response regulator, partial [Myxococcales bacterium]|nr:response regulator [Myxococcales bacterium]
ASPSLVLTDVAMPTMGGLELSRKLATLHPQVPVVFMSGHIDSPETPGELRALAIGSSPNPSWSESLRRPSGERWVVEADASRASRHVR